MFRLEASLHLFHVCLTGYSGKKAVLFLKSVSRGMKGVSNRRCFTCRLTGRAVARPEKEKKKQLQAKLVGVSRWTRRLTVDAGRCLLNKVLFFFVRYDIVELHVPQN